MAPSSRCFVTILLLIPLTMKISKSVEDNSQAIFDAVTSKRDGIPGVVFGAVDRQGKEIIMTAAGLRELGGDSKMTNDTVFWIASCTKTITGYAVMQLVEQGEVDLDDPEVVLKKLPELANAKIVGGTQDNFTYKSSETKITTRMLLTHTSGLGYSFFHQPLKDLGFNEFEGLQKGVEQPLAYEPNTRFNYGTGVDWAGILVERISGLKLGDYFEKHIFGPLGIRDTAFELKDHMRPRLASMHHAQQPGGTVSVGDHFPLAHNKVNEFHSGGGGLFGTVADYLQLLVPLMNGGLGADGKTRILKAETVKAMQQDQLEHISESLEYPLETAWPEVMTSLPNIAAGVKKGWGLTFMINKSAMPWGRSTNSLSWVGLANLFWWCDVEKGIAGMTATQILPFGNMDAIMTSVAAEAELYKGVA